MLTRVVLASPHPLPSQLLTKLPGRPTVAETEFGQEATVIADVADPDALRRELLALADGVSVGVITGALATDSAQLVMFDVDSTLTTTEAIDLLAAHVGKGAEVAAITERAMRGELDFAASLRERVATLAGLSLEVLDAVGPLMTLSPGARSLIATLQRHGIKTGVTSGGFIQLVRPLAERLGLDFANANQLEVANGRLTGRVSGDIVDAARKRHDLESFAHTHEISLARTVAVGDGANDLLMLDAAGLGIAYCAKPVTAAKADVAITFPRLDAVGAFAVAP